MIDSELLAELYALGQRFQGMDIQFRRDAPWEGRLWRIQVFTSKNERLDYRLQMHGDTFNETATALLHLVKQIDSQPFVAPQPEAQ